MWPADDWLRFRGDGPLEATNRANVTELRMDGVPLTDVVLADLIGQAYQAAVAQVATLAPGSNLVPPAK
jgi:hypothetical protein